MELLKKRAISVASQVTQVFFALSRVPPVFALHFVEGLPDSDVGIYSFNFKGKHYSVSSVIQYDAQLKHFVTWIHKPDGECLF